MKNGTGKEIMHWTDWENVVRLARSIDENGEHEKMHELKGSTIIELCELVSNNGQGIYHWLREMEPANGE